MPLATQGDLANQTGFRLGTLQHLEAAEQAPGERTLVKIEAALGRAGV